MLRWIMPEKKVGFLLVLTLSLVYSVIISYAMLVGGEFFGRFILPFFVFIPVSGVIGFFYGLWSGKDWLSFSIGFFPVFIFFITGTFFGADASTFVVLGLIMGFLAGLTGYCGATKKKGKLDWIILVPASLLLWIFLIMGTWLSFR